MLMPCLLAGAALAAPEEIEVYQDELNAPGGVGLETNANYVVSGHGEDGADGVQDSFHRLRVTPELAYGLAPGVEIGALAVATVDHDGDAGVHGAKVRIRYIAPHKEGGWYWGGNLEVGAVDRRMDADPWGAELRAILGGQHGRWRFSVNPTLEWGLSGAHREPLSFELQSKLGYRLREDLMLGLESYDGFGAVSHLAPGREEHILYAAADAAIGRVDLNFGVGRGLDHSSDGWVIKTVIGVPLR